VLVMSNGGFQGIHERLLAAFRAKAPGGALESGHPSVSALG
jgi:hypothetical protein